MWYLLGELSECLSHLMQRAQVNVGSVLRTRTSPSCSPLQTTWTLEQYHHNCSFVMIYMKFCDVDSDVYVVM